MKKALSLQKKMEIMSAEKGGIKAGKGKGETSPSGELIGMQ